MLVSNIGDNYRVENSGRTVCDVSVSSKFNIDSSCQARTSTHMLPALT
jgi:hypothetical protein